MKKLYLPTLLFLLVFCILGLPFTDWGFKSDDCGNLWHSITTSWQDFLNFFLEEKTMGVLYTPSNAPAQEQSFFCGAYRPMSFVYFALQYFLCKTSFYGYFLATITIHALSCVLLFHLFSFFTSQTLAFISAAYFGFHPSLWNWLGWISAQPYQIELFNLLAIIFLLKYFFDRRSWLVYFIACMLFFFTAFLHEQAIAFPFWLLLAIPFYKSTRTGKKFAFFQNIGYSLPFFCISIIYLLKKLYHFPLTANTKSLVFEPTWQSFITRQLERRYDFVTYISDTFGLSFLPNNHPAMKGLLIITIGSSLLWLSTKTKHKKIILFLAFSTLFFSWPALLIHNQPRFYYIAIPLFITLVIVLVSPQIHTIKYRSFIFFMLVGLIAFNAYTLFNRLKIREAELHVGAHAMQELVKRPEIQKQALCFINIPDFWFSNSTAQAVWFLCQNNKHPIFQFETKEELTSNKNQNIFKHRTKRIIPYEYHQYNPLCITWDKEKQLFIILGNQ